MRRLLASTFIISLAMGLTGLALPLYAKDLGANYTEVGLLGAMYVLLNVVFSPIVGRLADKHGRRAPIIVGYFLTAISLALYPAIGAVWWLLAVRLIQGAAEAPLWVNAQTAMADASEPANRGRAMGIYGVSWGIGFTIGPLLGGYLYTIIGASALFFIGSIMAFVAAFIVSTAKFPKPKISKKVLPKGLGFACLIGFVYVGVVSVIFTLFPVYGRQLGMSEMGIGLVIMLFAMVRAISFIPMGSVSDKIGVQPIIASGLFALAIASATLMFAKDYFLIAAIVAAIAIAEGAIYPSIMSIVTKIGGQNSAYILGVFNAVSVLGWGVLPPIGGVLADNVSPVAPYMMCSIVALVSLISLLKIMPKK
jgi:MFS family permease